ncbi:MAG: ABC transporter ATP-binding protein [Deltaproteobacteria bacterium]
MLEIKDLRAGYGNVEVIHGINVKVKEGECVALIGANGAGKTSTLKCICGLLPKMSGSIWFMGKDITGVPGHKIVNLGITMCPEGRQVFPEMTVLENLEMGAYTRKDKGQAQDLKEMIDMFPILGHRVALRAGTLSGGEQNMLAIARALISRPKLCLFDEPSLGLAPKIVAEVEQTIAKIKEMGKTVLLVEQNSLMALRLADRAYLFESGKIVLEGRGEELQENPDIAKAYLGQ